MSVSFCSGCVPAASKPEEEFDPICDKNNPRKITYDDISAAARRIQDGVVKTQCVPSHMPVDMQLYLKCEFLQYTGSFKERGARNALKLLSEENKKRGVVAASLGNHSQGMSYHGLLLNIPVTVVMPKVAPLMKIDKCRKFGANVIIHGVNMSEAKSHALKIAKEQKLLYVNGYDHPDIMAGQGTIGLEILEQVPDVDAVLVPCGGGGLLAGIVVAIKHLKPQVLVYGVETDKCCCMTEAMKKGKPVSTVINSTLADGLAVATAGYNAFFNIKPLLDKMVVVSEEWAARGILRIMELEKFVVEGGGAVAVAATLADLVPELKGKKVVCVLSGGNIDTTLLGRVLDRGMAAEHRLVKFKVNVPDSPGSLGELCQLIGSIGITIKDLTQERAWIMGNIFLVRVQVVCETRGPEHARELRDLISKRYDECFFRRESVRQDSVTDSFKIVIRNSM